QLCTSHIPLADYLHRIKHAETRKCEKCWEWLHIMTRETVNHFLFECPEYAEEWHVMNRALG
ncbi:hypothetical protein BDQ17DRAFT_1254816, partial [Cyathus striatus]